jgi:peptidoglycan/LPS O-acetylase OafA/YrhL
MFDSLGYGLLLVAEGSALLVWGTLTRVRRRAAVGLAAITAAILLAVAIPVVEQVREGLAGGVWLTIGAVAAVLFILAGSLIEKSRRRLGDVRTRISEIIEEWE